MTDSENVTRPAPGSSGAGRLIGKVLVNVLLPLLVLFGGYLGAKHMMETGPEAERRPAKRRARLVEVVPARAGSARAVVMVMGTVEPSREVVLRPRVSGQVVWVAEEFVPGGRFEQGRPLLRLDPTDFELAVKKRASELARAQADLALEEGNQEISRREYEMLGTELSEKDRALLLRVPQLAAAEASVDSARAALEGAENDLARVEISAPFPSLVRDRHVNLGTQVGPSSALATLAGTGEYWVSAAVPVDRLRWIRLPSAERPDGSPARVFDEAAWGPGESREGRVALLLGDLEPAGRMARVLVSVADPVGASGRPLLLGSYVRVEIDGVMLEDVVPLPQRLLRDGESVWVMDDGDKLAIRTVTIAFRDHEYVYLSAGLQDGERVVVSNLSSPVTGMPLRVPESADDADSKDAGAGGKR